MLTHVVTPWYSWSEALLQLFLVPESVPGRLSVSLLPPNLSQNLNVSCGSEMTRVVPLRDPALGAAAFADSTINSKDQLLSPRCSGSCGSARLAQ